MNRLQLMHRGLSLVIVFAALCGFSGKSRAAVIRHDVPSSAYENFFLDPRFQSVGWLLGQNETGNYVAGSAVLIAPDWVLTAGHVIDNPTLGIYDNMWFSLSDSIYTEPPAYVFADQLIVYPGYSGSQQYGTGVDLGLLHLSSPVTGVTPAERFRGTDQRGTLMFTAGFGTLGTGTSGLGAYDGIGRAGSVIAETFASDPPGVYGESQYWNAEMHIPLDALAQPLEWQTSPGDSGGGWFANIDGRFQLVGIDSYYRGFYGYGGDSGAIRVSLYNDWIDSHVAAVPEPSTFAYVIAAAMTGGIVRLIRRHRRK